MLITLRLVVQMRDKTDVLQLFDAMQKLHPTNNISLQNEL